jgi:hypothetical protein
MRRRPDTNERRQMARRLEEGSDLSELARELRLAMLAQER